MGTPLTDVERTARYRAKHPDRVAATRARDNAKRVFVGRLYVGRAPTAEDADTLNDEARRYLDRQKQSGAEGGGRPSR